MDQIKLFPHETLALLQNRFVVRDHALPSAVASWANCYVRELSSILRPARVGSGDEVKLAENFRSDSIVWLTDEFASPSPEKEPFATLKRWQTALEQAIEFRSTRVSVQLARYEGDGARYVRHSDVGKHHADETQSSEQKGRRRYTMVYYMNPMWRSEENGGQLRIFYGNAGEHHFDVEPNENRLVIFPSHLEHEVLPSFGRSRWALTIWLYANGCNDSQPVLVGPASIANNNRIFVSIACYRDQDVANTLSDLFAKANDPSNITVGVCWQGDEAPPRVQGLDATRNQQIRWCLLPSASAAGPLFARNIILNRLYAGERYIFQIDAHSRFADKWDARLIADLLLCPNDKPILTAYPAGFRLDIGSSSLLNTIIDPFLLSQPSPVLCADRFDENGALRIVGRQPNSMSSRPEPCLFWAAGFSFSEARAFFESEPRPNVPYLFFGEETLMAYYFFRHGWHCFTPSGPNAIFHLWNSRSLRPETSLPVSGENKQRANKEYHRLIESYRGSASFAAYETMTGVNFKTQAISDKARIGGRSSWAEFKVGAPLPKKALSLIDQYLY